MNIKRLGFWTFFLMAGLFFAVTQVPAYAASPEISRVSPVAIVEGHTGDSITFTLSASDADGNLRGAEWYGNPASPSKVMLSIVPKTHAAQMQQIISFPDPGRYEITVSAFDLDYNYSTTLKWTVNITPPVHENPLTYRSLYVDGFDKILGNSTKEQELLNFIRTNAFSEIALYGLNPIFKMTEGRAERLAGLRAFISKAKMNYGLKAVKGIGCLSSDFDDIVEYNDVSDFVERFDGLLSEYEYWNTGPENFAGFIALLTHMKSVAESRGMSVEAYLGWLGSTGDKQDEANKIAALTDVVYLHAYRAKASDTYPYIKERLAMFATAKPGVKIRPIFSAEWRPLDICSKPHTTGVDNMCFMGQWFENNSIRKAENIFMDFYYFYKPSLPAEVVMDGYQYFAYSFLKDAVSGNLPYHPAIYNLLLTLREK